MPRLLPRAGTQRGSLARYLTGRPWDRLPELATLEQAWGLYYAEDATFSGSDLTAWVDRLGVRDVDTISGTAPQSSSSSPSLCSTPVVDYDSTNHGSLDVLSSGERDDVNTAWETTTAFVMCQLDTDGVSSTVDPCCAIGFHSNFTDRECMFGINDSQVPMVRFGHRLVGNDVNLFTGDVSQGEPSGWIILMLSFDGRNANPTPMRMFAGETEQTITENIDADVNNYDWLDNCRDVSSPHDMTGFSIGARYDVGLAVENGCDGQFGAAGWFRTLMSVEVMMVEIYWMLRRKYGS